MNKSSILKHLLIAGIFLCLLVVILESFPSQTSSFQYHFEVGKPWGYELITAEFDFPIYKTPEQLSAEREIALRDYTPYYRMNDSVGTLQLRTLANTEHFGNLSRQLRGKLEGKMREIYSSGLVTAAEIDRIMEQGYENVSVVNRRQVADLRTIKSLYTPRSAYSELLELASRFEVNDLREMNLNKYLVPNLEYDTTLSEQMYQSLLSSVSLTEGMVQKGEKVIDRGEIVSPIKFQILTSLAEAYKEKNVSQQHNIYSVIGEVVLLLYFLAMLVLYLLMFRRQMYSVRNVLFFSLLIGMVAVIACCLIRFSSLSIYLVPFMWVPVLVRVFYDSRTALYTHIVTTLLMSIVVAAPFEFIILQMAAGMVAIGSMKDISQRSQLAQTALIIFVAYSVVYTALVLATTGSYNLIDPWMYFYFFINAVLVIGAYGMVYVIERLFGFVSSITLVELTNVNSALMLEFAERAQGTFQHSLQVSNLATEAAKKIGADALLVRTGALYHDIGKLSAPQNFTENQGDGYNPLNEMSYEQAAQAVIAHVADGVQIAKKHNLPNIIISFILTHHGTSKVRYFYNSWLNDNPGKTPDDKLFTYPGPRPSTKETCILMMADAVEARSRSLQQYTPDSISEMVEQMISAQMADGQFSDSPLTLRDIEEIKQVFKEKITAMNHHRISYPEVKANSVTIS